MSGLVLVTGPNAVIPDLHDDLPRTRYSDLRRAFPEEACPGCNTLLRDHEWFVVAADDTVPDCSGPTTS